MTNRTDVQLLISDVDGDVFSDDQVDRFLALRGDNIFRASALALRTIANNQTQVLKVIRLLELTTDGAKVGDALRRQADDLEKIAAEEEAGEDGGAFDFGETIQDSFSYRDFILADALRNQT